MSLIEIDKELRDLELNFANVQREYPAIARNAALDRFAYDMSYAQAVYDIAHRAVADGKKPPTVAVQDAEATLMVAKQMEAARIAEAELDIAQKTIKSLESRLSSTQSRVKLSILEKQITNYQS